MADLKMLSLNKNVMNIIWCPMKKINDTENDIHEFLHQNIASCTKK